MKLQKVELICDSGKNIGTALVHIVCACAVYMGKYSFQFLWLSL